MDRRTDRGRETKSDFPINTQRRKTYLLNVQSYCISPQKSKGKEFKNMICINWNVKIIIWILKIQFKNLNPILGPRFYEN